MVAAVSALLLSSAAVLLQGGAASADDMDIVRERARTAFGWPAQAEVPSVAASAKAVAASLNATCYWPDVDYYSTSRANWLTITHLQRVQTMVQALTVPGSPVFQDPALTSAAHCALGTWLQCSWTVDGAPGCSNQNWWYKWIGIETSLQASFLMLGVNRTSPGEQAQLVTQSYDSAWWVNDYAGGANLISMLTVEIMRGAASSNTTALDQAFGAMWANAVVGNVSDNWQGVLIDSSYHFHGQQILSSAYGLGWLASLLQFWQVAQGTQWAMPTAPVAVLAKFIAEGDAMVSFGGQWDWGTQGRGIDRPGSKFAWGLDTEIMRALAAEEGAAPWVDAILRFADAVDGTPPTTPLRASKYMWTSDFYVHHRATGGGAGWGAALKMHGDNGVWAVVQNECDNSENLSGEHTGDGVLNVYANDGPTAASAPYASIFPLLDWNVINGITVEHDKPIEACTASSGDVWAVRNTAFVGGVTDGVYGAAAMDSATHNTTSQRSWFFFDEAIVAMATNLSNGAPFVPVPGDVWTTLLSRIIPTPTDDPVNGPFTVAFSNGTTAVLADGQYDFPSATEVAWFSVGGVGVVPALPASGIPVSSVRLGLDFGVRSGNWSSIGAYTGSVTARAASAYLRHGTDLPSGVPNGYAYLVCPNQTADSMPSLLVRNAGVLCASATEAAHGASTGSVNAAVTSVVFWAPGGAYTCPALNLTLSSMATGLVSYTEGQGTAQVTASHPTRVGGNLTFTLSRVATGAACTRGAAPGTTDVTVRLPTDTNLLGSSVTVTCTLS